MWACSGLFCSCFIRHLFCTAIFTKRFFFFTLVIYLFFLFSLFPSLLLFGLNLQFFISILGSLPLLSLVRRRVFLCVRIIHGTHATKAGHKINSSSEKKKKKKSVVWRGWLWKVHRAQGGINRSGTNLGARLFSEQAGKLVARVKKNLLNVYVVFISGRKNTLVFADCFHLGGTSGVLLNPPKIWDNLNKMGKCKEFA